MTEEEYFRKYFPDSCYGDKPLSPHWDYFQYGVEFGERESEKKIEELNHTIATLRQEKDNVSMHANAMEVVAKTRSDQLTKANELLKRFITLENCTLDYDDIKEAEQFLKDCEVEK